MAPRDAVICGIEIKKESICLAQYSPHDNTVVNASIIVKPLDDADPSDDEWSVLRTKCKKMIANIQCGGQSAAVSLPSEHAVVKLVSLDRDETDVSGAVGWDLSQHIIGTIDEYVYDYEACDAGDPAAARYLVAAYRSSQVQKVSALLRSCKLRPLVVDLDMFALIDVFEANYKELAAQPAVIVSGGEETSKVVLTRNGAFVDFEAFEHRNRQMSPADYVQAVQNAVGSFPADNREGAPFFLSGALFAQPQFSEQVIGLLGAASILNPFKAIGSKVEIPEADLARCIPYLGVSVGLALRAAAEVTA
jgi:Tfp pilus assembly PilM family ATPase